MKFLILMISLGLTATAVANDDPTLHRTIALVLPPTQSNPRNSEGDFVTLKDGRLLFVYTHFTGGGGDHSSAYLAGRYSSDGGKSWDATDTRIVDNDAKQNIMSVSLLRLADGRIAMFYLRKNSLQDCRPIVRFSSDEAATWGEPQPIIPDQQIGYYVLNNDRVIQLSDGRLVVPVALHSTPASDKPDWTGRVLCYLSDDVGETWRRSRTIMQAYDSSSGKRLITQEPGVVELRDGRVMMFVRSDVGSQLVSHSQDGGETWSALVPSTLRSPVSPATIERIPGSETLVCVWNDHANMTPGQHGKRTPLSLSISRDEGATWKPSTTLFDNPDGWYCYTAMEFTRDAILLAHCAGDRTENNGLAKSQITRIELDALSDLQR